MKMAGVADIPTHNSNGWINYYPHWNLDTFLDKHKPSQESEPNVFWISVPGPDHKEAPPIDMTSVSTYWNKLQTQGNQIDADDIKTIAVAVGYTSGKWMTFKKSKDIDETWKNVAKATADGRLGTSAKVSSRSGAQDSRGQEHVICVYTDDFSDAGDVYRVEQQLRHLGVTGKLWYKADIYTTLGIYARNPWGIAPTLFVTG